MPLVIVMQKYWSMAKERNMSLTFGLVLINRQCWIMQDNPDRYRDIPNVFLVRLSKYAMKSDLCGCRSWYQLGVWNNLRYSTKWSLFCVKWSVQDGEGSYLVYWVSIRGYRLFWGTVPLFALYIQLYTNKPAGTLSKLVASTCKFLSFGSLRGTYKAYLLYNDT